MKYFLFEINLRKKKQKKGFRFLEIIKNYKLKTNFCLVYLSTVCLNFNCNLFVYSIMVNADILGRSVFLV